MNQRLSARLLLLALSGVALAASAAWAQAAPPHPRQLVLIDTDIGDDIDDAFAVALALRSPELEIAGITTTFGDTALRAQLLQHLLTDTGHVAIPVAAGPATPSDNPFTQRKYAEQGTAVPAAGPGGDAALALFRRVVRAHPKEVTLIALGPLQTVASWIDRDPESFRLLRRVVMMGGAIHEGYRSATAPDKPTPAEPEWNVRNDPSGFRKLLASGVPLTLLPLDSTQIRLDRARRARVFAPRSPLTASLAELEREWGQGTPTLYDPLTVATVTEPALCLATPMRLRVDDAGDTLVEPGKPNAAVCLHSEREKFLDLLVERLTASPGPGPRPTG